ncbi:NDP-sugar synthase [Streptomyces sp. NPDC020731]|uniref:NDP-sugar synthase n=1 Tax=Streptomyces sp. NPDC020731 TaxID=3365085 RepID=UPI00379F5CE0
MHAIVLAGGKGTRLLPRTEQLPKPLLRFGPYPLLEIIVRRLRSAGFTRVTLCVSHLGEMIEEAFGDGHRLDVEIDYVRDEAPLGTAAPLLAVREWRAPAVVTNGDVLSAVDFAELYRAHRHRTGGLTVVVHRLHAPISYGVVDTDGTDRITAIREKPLLPVDVAAGVYVADPAVRRYIPAGTPLDMPELIERLIAGAQRVGAYRFDGPWHDIGDPDSYQAAQLDFAASPERYLRADTEPPAPAAASPFVLSDTSLQEHR